MNEGEQGRQGAGLHVTLYFLPSHLKNQSIDPITPRWIPDYWVLGASPYHLGRASRHFCLSYSPRGRSEWAGYKMWALKQSGEGPQPEQSPPELTSSGNCSLRKAGGRLGPGQVSSL